jgi:dTDP-4-dehydrorhamnose 3,5-epimerase
MRIEPMKGLEDVLLIHPDLHEDDRGYFYEVFNEKEFNEKTGGKYDFHVLQENESKSCKGVFRGLHFQKPPYEQAKLVRVLSGHVVDFAVDIRKDSPTFGKCTYAKLTGENKLQFFIPRGFAHGFYVFSDEAVFEYKCDNYYNKESEGGIRWDDKDILLLPYYNTVGKFTMSIKDMFDTLDYSPIILSEKDKNRITTLKDL